MNDGFKFRHYNELAKKFTYYEKPELQVCLNGDFKSGLIFPLAEKQSMYMGKYQELQQCTGLKDKNGKLIFEGDIVKLSNIRDGFNEVRQIVYKDCAFQFNKPNSMSIDKPLYCFAINYLNHYKHIEIEVIGNIYANPELLD